MAIVSEECSLLTVSEKGYGKRTSFAEYPQRGRGGQGVINIRTTSRNGAVVAIRAVSDEDDVIYITTKGQVVRTPVDGISQIGRATQGVRLLKLKEDDRVAYVARILPEEEDGEEDAPEEALPDGQAEPADDGADGDPEENP